MPIRSRRRAERPRRHASARPSLTALAAPSGEGVRSMGEGWVVGIAVASW